MIISDRYKFCFVHIPKCAGTSVRGVLQNFDDCNGAFTVFDGEHFALGKLDYGHIPLQILAQYFPVEFEKITNYYSFAVMRDPFSRFPSSLAQRLQMYRGVPIKNMSKKEINNALDESINQLLQWGDLEVLPPEYIHFQKQCSYIFCGDSSPIDRIYTTENIAGLLTDIGERTGIPIAVSVGRTELNKNQSIVYRSAGIRAITSTLRPMCSKPLNMLLPGSYKQAIRDFIYVPRDKRLNAIFRSDYIRAFVEDYYSVDIKLFESVTSSDFAVSPAQASD